MILPNKTIYLSDSLLGFGALLLSELNLPTTLSALWETMRKTDVALAYEKFILTIDFLYALGLIEMKEGLLMRSER